MKATFASTKKVDFLPIDNNEYLLLENFQDIAEGRIKIESEISSKADKKSFSLSIEEPSNISVGDNLAGKTITMLFPTKYYEKERALIESHDIIETRGGMKITCIVDGETGDITIKMIFDVDDEVVLYKFIAETGTVTTNLQLIKIFRELDMTVSYINADSNFYQCFMI